LKNEWNVASEKISIVYEGTHDQRLEGLTAPSNLPMPWAGKYIFTAGSLLPYRGLEDIINALDILKKEGIEQNLVVAGSAPQGGQEYQQRMKRLADKCGLRDNIIWTDFLNQEQTGWCYANCRCFVMSSRVESFGHVALEALSYGCLCIAADNPCLPEIFQDAALYYEPRDSHLLADRIKDILTFDVEQKLVLSRAACGRASEFSWDDTAQRTVEALQAAIPMKCTGR
ncbi:MAG: glycosyltransferase, partial [Candidatus Omnitrophica bacterium]|nr:glycosyltransferase [Candidatus Omnitrophota bacterium]